MFHPYTAQELLHINNTLFYFCWNSTWLKKKVMFIFSKQEHVLTGDVHWLEMSMQCTNKMLL